MRIRSATSRRVTRPAAYEILRRGLVMGLLPSVILFLVPSRGNAEHRASICSRLRSNPDVWVRAGVERLVKAAHAAFDDDQKLPDYHRVLDQIAAALRRCRVSQDESFVNRYREFIEYIEAASLDRRPGHELGFIIPDRQYFAETRQYVEIPAFLMAPTFLRSVSRYETLDRAKAILRMLNSTRNPSEQLLFLSYRSRHLGTPDNDDSRWRLLIVVPGDRETSVPEKWVQFGIPDPGARTRIRNVSVVSAITSADGKYEAYFKDYFRTYRRNGSITVNGRWELGYGDDNCVRCHKSGVLPIFPADDSVCSSEQEAVIAINQRFRSYGSVHFGKYLDQTKLGPGLGSSSWEDRIRRFGESFCRTKVAPAMACAACHRNEFLGPLNWPMESVVISSYVKGGQMPLGYEFTANERDVLYDRLIQEYFATEDDHPGILKSWLLGKAR